MFRERKCSLWTPTFTPRARGDTTGTNKAGFLLYEGTQERAVETISLRPV